MDVTLKSTGAQWLLLCSMALCLLSSCEKALETTSDEAPSSGELTVTTRAGDDTPAISYPIHVYVMDGNGACVKKESVVDEHESLSFQVVAGTYQVYAVAGADGASYVLPTAQTATAADVFTLRSGATHGDLMAAGSEVTVSKSDVNHVTLDLVRKVLRISDVTIKEVPAGVEAVTVTLSPVYAGLQVDGSYSAETTALSIALEKQGDNTTWANTAGVYSLPAAGAAKLLVAMTQGGEVTTYEYDCPKALNANSEVSISGTYTGQMELDVNGHITGTSWGEETDITFTFDEDNKTSGGTHGGSGQYDNSGSGAIPAEKDWYKQCYVISVTDNGAYTTVTLMHRDEQQVACSESTPEADVEAAINAILPSFDINGITGWRLPTKAEAYRMDLGRINQYISQDNDGGTPVTNNVYLGKEDGRLFSYNSQGSALTYYYQGSYVRPVTTVTFQNP